jgi:hypothetical protein
MVRTKKVMSHLELVDRLFALSNRCAIGDGTAMSELLAAYHRSADVGALLDVAPPGPGGTESLIRSYFEQVSQTCYVWYIYADQLQEHGDKVLALGGIRTVEKPTHDDREQAVGWIFQIRENKVAAVHAYPSYAEATAALRSPL